jgi:hypothetical protein
VAELLIKRERLFVCRLSRAEIAAGVIDDAKIAEGDRRAFLAAELLIERKRLFVPRLRRARSPRIR